VLLLCFTDLENPDKAHMFPIFEHCLASIMYHFDWLISHLPSTHPLFQTNLFSHRYLREQLDSLKSNVEYRLATVNDRMQPTGIPPHVRQLIATKKSLTHLESLCMQNNVWRRNLSDLRHANSMFDMIEPLLPQHSGDHTRLRSNQLTRRTFTVRPKQRSWRTVGDLIRKELTPRQLIY
jgi:hypothetical protein